MVHACNIHVLQHSSVNTKSAEFDHELPQIACYKERSIVEQTLHVFSVLPEQSNEQIDEQNIHQHHVNRQKHIRRY